MPGYAKRTNKTSSRRVPPRIIPSNREYYSGANQTRNSICNNPSAYVSYKDPNFGRPTFRTVGFASEAMRDAQAERTMNGGYTKRKNKLCPSCFVQKSTTGKCMCED